MFQDFIINNTIGLGILLSAFFGLEYISAGDDKRFFERLDQIKNDVAMWSLDKAAAIYTDVSRLMKSTVSTIALDPTFIVYNNSMDDMDRRVRYGYGTTGFGEVPIALGEGADKRVYHVARQEGTERYVWVGDNNVTSMDIEHHLDMAANPFLQKKPFLDVILQIERKESTPDPIETSSDGDTEKTEQSEQSDSREAFSESHSIYEHVRPFMTMGAELDDTFWNFIAFEYLHIDLKEEVGYRIEFMDTSINVFHTMNETKVRMIIDDDGEPGYKIYKRVGKC